MTENRVPLPTVPRTLTTSQILHLLRNPYGHSEDELRRARLEAADEIERLTAIALDPFLEATSKRIAEAIAAFVAKNLPPPSPPDAAPRCLCYEKTGWWNCPIHGGKQS